MSTLKFNKPLYTPPKKPETEIKPIPVFAPASSAPEKPALPPVFTKKYPPKGGKTRKYRSKKKKTHRRRR
jgi:hypothetical protein